MTPPPPPNDRSPDAAAAFCVAYADGLRAATELWLDAYRRYRGARAWAAAGGPTDHPMDTVDDLGLVSKSGLAALAGVTPAVVTRALQAGTLPDPVIPAPPPASRFYTAEEAAHLARRIKAGKHRPGQDGA